MAFKKASSTIPASTLCFPDEREKSASLFRRRIVPRAHAPGINNSKTHHLTVDDQDFSETVTNEPTREKKRERRNPISSTRNTHKILLILKILRKNVYILKQIN